MATLCVLCLLDLPGGWIEIPDCLPVIGDLDEVALTVALVRCLATLGFSVLSEQGWVRQGRRTSIPAISLRCTGIEWGAGYCLAVVAESLVRRFNTAWFSSD